MLTPERLTVSRQTVMNGVSFLLLFTLMTAKYPVIFSFLPFSFVPGELIIVAVVTVMSFSLLGRSRISYGYKSVQMLILVQFAIWMGYYIFRQESAYLSQIGTCIFVEIVYLYIVNFTSVRSFVKIYIYIVTAVAVAGMLAFFGVLTNVLHPLFEYQNMDGRTGYFFGLTCTNTYAGNFIRYSGIFDEPGAMANWGMWALLLNKLVLKNKRIELALAISLIFTFSMAYYIQMAFYLLFFHIRSWKQIGIGLTIGGLFVMIANSAKDTEYQIIYDASIARFERNDSGQIIQDTKKVFLQAPLIGVGPTRYQQIIDNGTMLEANLFAPLARDGVIGTLGIYLFFIFLLIYGLRHPEYLKYWIILFLGFYQRNAGLSVYYVVLSIVLYAAFLDDYLNSKTSCPNIKPQFNETGRIHSNCCI